METKTFTYKFISILTVFWGIYFIPSILMVIFALTGHTTFLEGQELLYYNVLIFPVILAISCGGSWLAFRYEKYLLAKIFALLPLASVFIEIIAADLLFFA